MDDVMLFTDSHLARAPLVQKCKVQNQIGGFFCCREIMSRSLISDGELRKNLKYFGVDVGPIMDTTRNLYQRKLRSLTSQGRQEGSPRTPQAHHHSPQVRAGVKRQRTPIQVGGSALKQQQGSVRKRLKLEEQHSSVQVKRKGLYPDLSEWFPESPVSSVLLPDSPSVKPFSQDLRPRLHQHQAGSERPHPSGSHLRPQFQPYRSPIIPSALRDTPSSDSSDIPSPVESGGESPLSGSLTPPSPEVSPPSSPYPDPPPVSSSPKPAKAGFLQTITKLFGGVNKFFNNNSPEPRRSLKPAFDFNSPSRKKAASGRSQGPPGARFKPVNLASIEEDAVIEMGEASSLSSENSEVSLSPASASSSKSYDWELDPTEVSLCKKADGSLWRLGKGGFGEVFKGLRDGVDEVAVKIIRINSCSPRTIAEFKAEIDLISKLRHRHIMQFYGACIQPQNLYMVTELMSSDLFSMLRLPLSAERYKWSGIYGKEVLVGVATGLNYLHSRKPAVVHRDIKSPNILVMDGLAKIADVGVARTMGTSDMTAQKGFTIAWAAPEVVYRRRATEKIDIWSLGIILWEVVSGKLPRPGKLVLPDHSPPPLRTLYTHCISDDPSNRPSAQEVIAQLKNIRE